MSDTAPVNQAALARFAFTVALGTMLFVLFTAAMEFVFWGGGQIIVYMLLVVAFGVLAPSRSGAFLVAALVPFYAMAQCSVTDSGVCGSELGFPFYLFVFWMLLMLPMLLATGLGWALGIRWRGRRLVHHWSRPRKNGGPEQDAVAN